MLEEACTEKAEVRRRNVDWWCVSGCGQRRALFWIVIKRGDPVTLIAMGEVPENHSADDCVVVCQRWEWRVLWRVCVFAEARAEAGGLCLVRGEWVTPEYSLLPFVALCDGTMGEGRLVAAMRRGINQFIHAFISGDAGMPADPYEDEFEAAMDGRLRDGAEGPEEGVVGVQMREQGVCDSCVDAAEAVCENVSAGVGGLWRAALVGSPVSEEDSLV